MSDESVALFISLYTDEGLHRHLPALLRTEGFDVVSALELRQTGKEWDDGRQLAYAVSNHRAILSRNRNDFIRLAQEYEKDGREHYGIIITQQLPLGELARYLLRLLDSVTADEMKNTFRYLSDFADRQ